MLPSWWRNLVKVANHNGKLARRGLKKRATRPRPNFRPSIELFEDRLVPTTLGIPNNITGARNAIVPVPINVTDTLVGSDVFGSAATGLDGAQFVVFFNPQVLSVSSVTIGTMTTGGSSSVGSGYSPTTPNNWGIATTTTTPAGYLYIDLETTNFQNFITGAATGSLVVINFTVNSGAALGATRIDLAADTGGAPPFTSVLNNTTGVGYKLTNPPQDNTVLGPPYSYTGSDPNDGTVTVTGTNLPPVVVNQSYSITERAVAGDPALTVAAPGVLQGDTDPQGAALTASAGSVAPAHGAVTINSNGSLSYTPVTGFLGTDTFTYVATDTFGASSTGTVTVSVTPRLSLQASASPIVTPGPVTLSGAVGGTVKVFVDVDNPNPATSGGITGANFYIDYNPNIFSVTPDVGNTPSPDVSLGSLTPSSGWNTSTAVNVGTTSVNTGMDVLGIALSETGSNPAPITSTLPGSLVVITFHVNPSAAFGSSTLQLDPTSATGSFNTIISCANSNSLYNFSLPLRPALPDPRVNATVNIVAPTLVITAASNSPNAGTPFNFTVTARDTNNNVATAYTGPVQITSSDAQAVLPPSASLTNGVGVFTITLKTANAQTVTATDTTRSAITGTTTFNVIAGVATHFAVTIPTTANAGSPFVMTVAAKDQFGNTAPTYTGTVTFTSTDLADKLPANSTLTAGLGTFNVTFTKEGVWTITATDANSPGLTGTSSPISISAGPFAAFGFTVPATAIAGSAFTITLSATDAFGNPVPSYSGTVHFTKSDSGVGSAVPTDYTFVPATDLGVHKFTNGVTLVTAGPQTITATDTTSGASSTSSAIIVSPTTANHLTVSAVSPEIAGVPFTVTVTAKDAFNNVATGYTGSIQFTKTDTGAGSAVPPNYTFTATDAGVHVFSGAILVTVGNQTITATDVTVGTGTSGITGSAPVTVNPAAAKSLTITAPASTTAGSFFTITVTALDQFGNTATGYTGTVHFTTSDTNAQAVVPADYTFTAADRGVHVFTNAVKLVTVGSTGKQTITASDNTTPLTAATATVTVTASVTTHYVLSAVTPETAGVAFTLTVTAQDAFNNTATSYLGTVSFTKTDTGASSAVPANYTFTAADNGIHIFSGVKLATVGTQTITATDTVSSTVTGNVVITVTPNVAASFHVTAPSTATAGAPFSITVTALDAFGNTATGYLGTVHFTKTDTATASSVPANYTFVAGDAGIHTFTGVTLITAGSQTITATDTSTASITGSATVTVAAATVAKLSVVASTATPTAGVAFTVTVTAQDTFGNTVPGYLGTVHFTKTDTATGSSVPANYTFVAADNGVHVFSTPGVTLVTAASQTLTATDTATASITGSATVTVAAAAAKTLTVSAPASAVAGAAFTVTVTAKDSFGNIATAYLGTVHFSSTDTGTGVVLPPNYAFVASDNGVHTFTSGVTLVTAGARTVTATDTSSGAITGSATVTVTPGAAATLSVTAPATASAAIAFTVTVTAKDSFGNTATAYTGTVHFSSTDTGTGVVLPADYKFVTGDAGVHTFSSGVTLVTLGVQTVTATDTSSSAITGHAAVTVNPPPATHFTVSAPASTAAGAAFTITVTALNVFNTTVTGYTGTVHFSKTDTASGSAVPANYTFTAADAGVHVFTNGVTFITAAVSTVTATDTVTASITGNAVVTVTPLASTHLVLTAPTLAVANTPLTLTVKAEDQFNNIATAYTGTVHFSTTDTASGVVLPANYTFTAGDAGVHVFTNGVTLVTTGLQTVTATDTVTSSITGNAVFTVPVTLSMPTNLSAGRGTTVTIPINVNALNDPINGNSGLSAGSFVLNYNPAVFTVSNTDIALGTVPNSTTGWTLPNINTSTPGYLSIALSNDGSGIITGTGGGSLVTITFHVTGHAPFGPSTILLAADTNGGSPFTSIADQNFNNYNLQPAPSDSPNSNDGIITITGTTVAPVASNDSYAITERTVATDPSLTLTAASGVLAPGNAFSADGDTLTAVKVTNPADGTLTFNSDGSFVYTPNLNFHGTDSFTFQAADGSLLSNIATVTLNVTSRLSVPTNLTGVASGQVVVPVNIDNPNPAGSGGLDAVNIALDWDPTMLTEASVQTGTVTSPTNEVQTLFINGTPFSGSFTLSFNNTASGGTINGTTNSINYSSVLTTLQNNIQNALNNLFGAGNTLVSVTSATSATVTLQGTLANTVQPVMTANSANLVGLGPTVSPVITTFGVPTDWQSSLIIDLSATTGQIGIALATGTPDQNTAGGSLVLVTFNVNAAASGQTLINLAATNSPTTGATVTTRLDAANQQLLLRPPVTNANNDPFVDGIVTIQQVTTHLQVAAPASVTAGTPANITVSALDVNNAVAIDYLGTVHFSSSDLQAGLPANYTFQASDAGVHVFAVTFKTLGTQTVTATDTTTASITGSATLTVNPGTINNFVVTAPANATAGNAFAVTVTARDQFNNVITNYTGTVAFASTDSGVGAAVPANYTFTAADRGVHVFSNGVTLVTAGSQTVTVDDVSNPTSTGSAVITVSATTANHLTFTAPATVIAGVPFTVTVTAKDQFNNVAKSYTGTIHFSKTDTAAGTALPPDYTFVSADQGVHVFSSAVTLVTAGTQQLTATDDSGSSTNGITGSTSVIVGPAAAASFTVSAPATTVAGVPFTVTVTARDSFGNVATGYTGIAHFATTDTGPGFALPADYTFLTTDKGIHVFTNGVTLVTSGTRTVSVTDTVNFTITGSAAVTVTPAAAATLTVTAPATVTAGAPFALTVTALDAFNNTATGYTGTIHFSKTDSNPASALPADYTFVASDHGVHVFSGSVLATVGSQTVTATDKATSSIKGSATIFVNPAGAATFTVSAPATATAGVAFTVTVTALDLFGNTATGYTGTVHFTKSDTGAGSALPPNYTFVAGDSGVHVFTAGVTLATSGAQTVTAADTSTSSITGSATVTVSPAAVNHLKVTAPATFTAGAPFTITVTAQDSFNNTTPSYLGTVHFSSTDTNAAVALPADYTFVAADNGVHVFTGVTLITAGSQTVTATDTSAARITGSATITISPAATTTLVVSAPATATAGSAFNITVTAKDTFGNTVTGYVGIVHFTSTDLAAALPANSTLTGGTGTFSATLKTAGSQTVTATDTVTSTINGKAVISVSPAAANHLTVTAPATVFAGIAFTATVTALDPFNNVATAYVGTVHFRSTDTGTGVVLPADYTFVAADKGVHVFTTTTLVTLGTQTVTATDTASATITGSAVVTVNAPPATHFTVSAPASINAGSAFSITVTALNVFNATVTGYTGTVHFSKTDTGALSLVPANYTFTAADAGVHVFTNGVTLVTAGAQTVTATDTVSSTVTGSAVVTVAPLAVTHFVVTAPTDVIATRPFTVTVTAEDQFNNVATAYSGTVHFTATDTAAGVVLPANYAFVAADKGVHVFTNGFTLQTVGLQTITATDTQTSAITGSAVVTVPVTLFIPTNLSGSRGGVVAAPIDVNALDDPINGNTGLAAGSFVVYFNPNQFTVSSTDVVLGSLTSPSAASGWTATTVLNGPGYIGITLTDDGSGIITGTAGGSLVVINFHVKSGALLGPSSIDLAADTGGGAPTTSISDQNFSNYTLVPNPVDNTALSPVYAYTGSDPDDGTILVTGVNLPPVAVNDSYDITERDVATDPALTIAAPGVLANDTDPQGFPLTAIQLTSPSHGTLAFNSSGSFVYTPNLGYNGPDSFTYEANDGFNLSNVATVSLAVSSRLSIPTTLSGVPGGTVVVPVNIDNPNPGGSGGLTGATLAINYNPAVFTVSAASIQLGTVTSGNAVQSITFGGTVTGGTFTLALNNFNTTPGTTLTTTTTGPISYSTSAATLQTNIQAALDALQVNNFGTPGTNAGNTLVSATSATSVSVTFQGILGASAQPNLAVSSSSLTGTNPTAAVATTLLGYGGFQETATVNPTTGEIGISLVSSVPDINTVGGSLVLITFQVNLSAAAGPSQIILEPTNAPTGSPVTTRLDALNGQLLLRPALADTFVPNVDGIVNIVAATHFTVVAPSGATEGVPFNFTVTALDQNGHVASAYQGTVQFSSTDALATLPASTTLTNGTGTFSATLATPGNQTISATDVNSVFITGTSYNINVSGPATHFAVTAPAVATAGTAFVFSVTALDQSGNAAAGFTGTVHFSSSDVQAGLPSDVVLTGGSGVFAATLRTAGPQTVTATATASSAITGTSKTITVIAGAATHFVIAAPATVISGTAFSFTVTAKDAFNNTTTSYGGTVHFTSSDAAATLPANSTLTDGSGTFTATLQTLGNQSITAADTVSSAITGTTSTVIAVRGLIVTSFTPTPTGFVSTFSKPLNVSLVNLYNTAVGPADVTLVGPSPSTNSIDGSLLLDPTDTTITFLITRSLLLPGAGTAGLLAAGNYSVTFRSGTNGFVDTSGDLLDGLANGTTANYVTSFTVAASTNLILSMPDFARGPNGAANILLPNSGGTGIPVTLTNPGTSSVSVTDVSFNLNYNPALLNISAAQNGASGTFTLGAVSGGVATFTFHSGTAVAIAAGGTFTLGQITAQVPNAAAATYKAKALLHLSNIATANSGAALPTTGNDGIEVDAYLGDVSGQGAYIPLDSSLISRVAVALDPGFAAYQTLDPTIIGSIGGNSAAFPDSADVTLMNRFLAGIPVAQLPAIPTGLTIVPTGPDPTISLPASIAAVPGETVVVPINIDTARPTGSTGLVVASLALSYDPKVFSVSPADVQLGMVPASGSGWTLSAAVNAETGVIGIDLFSTTPITTTAGGSLVTIAFHVLDTAAAGTTGLSLVQQVNPTGHRVYTTAAGDAEGAFVLHPAITSGGYDAGVDGLVTVFSTAAPAADAGLAAGLAPMLVSQASATATLSASPVQLQSTLGDAQANPRDLPVALVEQVFGLPDPSALAAEENQVGQPGPLVNMELESSAPLGARDLALLAQPAGAQGQWDDCLAQLAQTNVLRLGGPASDAVGDDAADLVGVDAFFALQGARK